MSLFTTLVGGKLLIGALAVGSVAVGGTAAAAATGELPTALQQQAHSVFGAPAPTVESSTDAEPDATETDSPEPTDTESPEPTDTTSPDPTATQSSDPATAEAAPAAPAVLASAHGLCTAWSKGGLATTSVAYTTLLTAAGGSATDISAWCLPHLVAPGHAKQESRQSGGTTAGSDATDTGSTGGQGHATSRNHDGASSDDQQGDDQQGDDQQGDDSTSGHGGSGSHGDDGDSSGSDH
jgi:hypothetical protein